MEERKCNYERYRGLVQNDFANSEYHRCPSVCLARLHRDMFKIWLWPLGVIRSFSHFTWRKSNNWVEHVQQVNTFFCFCCRTCFYFISLSSGLLNQYIRQHLCCLVYLQLRHIHAGEIQFPKASCGCLSQIRKTLILVGPMHLHALQVFSYRVSCKHNEWCSFSQTSHSVDCRDILCTNKSLSLDTFYSLCVNKLCAALP